MGVGPGRWRVRTDSIPREQRRGRYLEGQERVVLSVGNVTLGCAGENDLQERWLLGSHAWSGRRAAWRGVWSNRRAAPGVRADAGRWARLVVTSGEVPLGRLCFLRGEGSRASAASGAGGREVRGG